MQSFLFSFLWHFLQNLLVGGLVFVYLMYIISKNRFGKFGQFLHQCHMFLPLIRRYIVMFFISLTNEFYWTNTTKIITLFVKVFFFYLLFFRCECNRQYLYCFTEYKWQIQIKYLMNKLLLNILRIVIRVWT